MLKTLLDTEGLRPQGESLAWRPDLLWSHAIADTVIGLSYFSIPLVLVVLMWRRPDARFSRALWLFVPAITLCGVTHLLLVWTLWRPDYGLSALVKTATAAVSLFTAVILWSRLPRAIARPSTAALQARIAERDAALEELRRAMNTMLEMREHEARQKLLLDELNHRVKNTLTAVQSVAVQTLNDAVDMPEARDLFIERLMSLSATHNLLVKNEWESADFHELLDATLAPYGRPYSCSGPDLKLEANLAVSLGMAVHELATNALKHGAWRGEGRIDIEVAEVAGGQITIAWRERGGPPVSPPTRRGFGSRLLERGIAAEMRGQVILDFAATGLDCRIRAPLSDRLRVKRERTSA